MSERFTAPPVSDATVRRAFQLIERTMGRGPRYADTRRITADASVTSTDEVILADATVGGVTITLPLASTFAGREVVVKKIDASVNTVTVLRSGSDTIDGAASMILGSQWDTVRVVSIGPGSYNWFVM